LLEALRPAIETIDRQLADLSDLRERPSGRIRITAPDHATRTLLWPAIDDFLKRYPDIEIEINAESGLTDIIAERYDAGVRLGEQLAKDMAAVRIGPPLRMVAVAAPHYLEANGIPRAPHDLTRHKCINLRMSSSGGLYAWEFQKDGQAVNVRVEGQVTLNSGHLILQAALAGHGIAFLMDDYVTEAIRRGELQYILEDWCPPFDGYYLYYPSRRQPTPAFSLLVDALRYGAV
jgi:DNA-binding transcriptional LysR family regulator